jgi:hypothetical protein
MIKEKIILAIDFDGTCVTHEYPKVGKDIGAVPVLKKLVENGHQLMLWTMRGNKPTSEGVDTLQDAVDWFKNNNIPLWGINENPDQKATGWTNSNKQYAQMYIDDAALGCPLMYDWGIEKPYVDWVEVEKSLTKMGLI